MGVLTICPFFCIFRDTCTIQPGLIPRYYNCGRHVISGAERSFRLVRLLKHLHPTWGVAYILVRVRRGYPGLALQSERQYQRRLATQGGVFP